MLARRSAYLDCGPTDLLAYGPPGDYAVSSDGDLDEQYERPAPRLGEVSWRQLGPDEEVEEEDEEESE